MYSTTMHTAILLVAAAFLLHAPTIANAKEGEGIQVVITNNHTNYLSIRCFSFDDNFDAVHIPSRGKYEFWVKERVIFSSSTMFNCSTNMGTFVAYTYTYKCARDTYKRCDWRFDENNTYRWDPEKGFWKSIDYAPNYESLDRGGVIKGFFAN